MYFVYAPHRYIVACIDQAENQNHYCMVFHHSLADRGLHETNKLQLNHCIATDSLRKELIESNPIILVMYIIFQPSVCLSLVLV